MARLLVVDDERSMREMLEILLGAEHQVEVASDVPSALAAFRTHPHDLVLTDLMLGRSSGLDVLKAVKELSPQTEVMMMTAFSTTESGIQAMNLGACDYVAKPFKVDELKVRVQKALEKRRIAQDNTILRAEIQGRSRFEGLVGRSRAMQTVYGLVEKVGPTRTTILVTGESGTGKELIARAVHRKSPRANAAFVPVNCGAIPEGLIESELFGHVRGAFTGAAGNKDGLFMAANNGTLFLDEIGELPLGLQVKLLRAIQDRRIRQVGANEDLEVDVRLIAATNRDLAHDVRTGRFREDLYYRLNVIEVRVPPLRERREDIVLLAEHFLRRFAAERGGETLELSRDAKHRLDEYEFPGNVRELENLVERAVTLADGPEVTVDTLPAPLRGHTPQVTEAGPLPPGFSLEAHLAALEAQLMDRALIQGGGVKKEAARLLGLTFRQFRHRAKKIAGPGEFDAEDPEE